MAGSLTLSSAVIACTASVLDLWVAHGPLMFLVTAILSAAGAVFSLLAFVPPKRYLQWVVARAPKVAE